MRWARLRRWNILSLIVDALLFAGWAFGEAVGLPVPSIVFLVGLLVSLVVWGVLVVRTFRAMRADAVRVVAAHPGSAAFPSTITSWGGSEKSERESVIVVAADARGLSFRDHEDREVLLVPADRIMSLEVAPLEPRSRFRPFRVATIDGTTVDFTGPAGPDAQVDSMVALRTALGRSTG